MIAPRPSFSSLRIWSIFPENLPRSKAPGGMSMSLSGSLPTVALTERHISIRSRISPSSKRRNHPSRTVNSLPRHSEGSMTGCPGNATPRRLPPRVAFIALLRAQANTSCSIRLRRPVHYLASRRWPSNGSVRQGALRLRTLAPHPVQSATQLGGNFRREVSIGTGWAASQGAPPSDSALDAGWSGD